MHFIKFVRTISIILAFLMLFSFLAGCKNNPDEDAKAPDDFIDDPEDLVYVSRFIEIPGGPGFISAYTFSATKVYFVLEQSTNEDIPHSTTKIQTMNFDGTDISELQNYSPEIHSADYSNIDITAITIDDDENIWISERSWLYRFNLPADFSGEEHEKYDYLEDAGSYKSLIKLDNTGNTLLTVDISDLLENEYSSIFSLLADNDGNIFALTRGLGDANILVFKSDGTLLFNIDVSDLGSGPYHSLVRLLDGTIAYSGRSSVTHTYALQKIDFSAQSLGDMLDLPHEADEVYSGEAGFMFLCSDGISLFGIDAQTDETIHLLDWFDHSISNNEFSTLTMLPDGSIVTILSQLSSRTYTLLLLTKVPLADVQEPTILTLATFGLNVHFENSIHSFNKTNPNYFIHVIDYGEFSNYDDWTIGLIRLSTDIISGNAPDIINTQNLPIHQYVNKGLLLDLYKLLDNDSQISRENLVSAALRETEINGGLYQISPYFFIDTIIGSPEILGNEPGWTMDEFKAVIDANPNADFPIGLEPPQNILNLIFENNVGDYVNWETGSVNFDSEDFIQLLKFAAMFSFDYSEEYIDFIELVATGRQIMQMSIFGGDPYVVGMHREWWGGDFVAKGYPSANRQGNTMKVDFGLAITTNCKDVDGAWEFLRTFLLKEWQQENRWLTFPFNKSALEETYGDDEQILALIDSATGSVYYDTVLLNIVAETASDYFNGLRTAESAARIIQSRAAIYVSEQSE
ncbi:MAG: extracellular solute-binding protein [Oscillospiraceae bacterium]|nr:extracellular solute-binding protein [Oscillospiraceae bacterium]